MNRILDMYKKWELDREKAVRVLGDIGQFSEWLWKPHALRPYQAIPARAIARTIIDRSWGRKGRPNEYAVVFARQAGKDEMVAQLLGYLLNLAQGAGGQIVLARLYRGAG
jgi:hypothetical protein